MRFNIAKAMTRAGFAARGIMYFLIGFLVFYSGRTEDGAGALKFLGGGSGRLLLGAMAVGFAGYGIWRLSEAAIDTEGHGSDAKGTAIRLGGAASGVVHLALCFIALKLALGDGSGGSGSAQQGAATALDLPGGRILMISAAAVLILVGLYQLIKAYRAGFLRHLHAEAARRRWIRWMGRSGYAARSIVFLMMGWFFLQSAVESRAAEAGGMGEALASLPETLQRLVAAGFILFGLFSLVEARFRHINDPRAIGRTRVS